MPYSVVTAQQACSTEMVKLYCIFHIGYKDIELITNKKAPTITCPNAIFAWAASFPFQYGGFLNTANIIPIDFELALAK